MVAYSMNKARFRFSTEIIRRLGEELNPSLDRGVLELVKNSYDADATECRVELHRSNQTGGTVVVRDNGEGMTVDDIINGWLVLGKSSKSPQRMTRLGRVPAGSKGLGRLAALRMGSRALMTTNPNSEPSTQHGLLIDWEQFDAANLVEDVELVVETTRTETGGSGTEIYIEDLHTEFGRTAVKRLARELILLADPFGNDPQGFRPELVAAEYSDLETLVQARYFQDAEYHLHAEVDGEGRAFAKVQDWKGNELFAAEHHDLTGKRGPSPYLSPPASFDLWVFILNREVFSTRVTNVKEVQQWLTEFGGVHVYCNGLRVAPYGGPGDDWLGMNLRRVRSPEERPGTNTSIGRLNVSDHQQKLVQKTDRSGFIESAVFHDLREFAQDAMEWMADRRMREAERRRARERVVAPKRSDRAKRQVEDAMQAAPPPLRTRIGTAFAAYEASREREVITLRKDLQLYRTLSTAGITATTFAHESSGHPIKVISQSIDAIGRRAAKLLGHAYAASLEPPVDGIRRAVRQLAVLGAAILDLVDHEKRRLSRVGLHDVVLHVIDSYRPFLVGRDVFVEVDLCAGEPYLRGSVAAVESIITNLLNNSLAAFEAGATQNRTIHVSTLVSMAQWRLTVADSGPGIHGIELAHIWLPGRTTRKNGTGLGLTIVRDSCQDLGGTVEATDRGKLGGAAITVVLPILGV